MENSSNATIIVRAILNASGIDKYFCNCARRENVVSASLGSNPITSATRFNNLKAGELKLSKEPANFSTALVTFESQCAVLVSVISLAFSRGGMLTLVGISCPEDMTKVYNMTLLSG